MTSNTHIIDLPLELWGIVSSHLPNRDIKSMRLVSKQSCNAVQVRLQRVFLSANPLNIAVFRAVADHEKFSHGVTEIIWDDARLARGPRRFARPPGWGNSLSKADSPFTRSGGNYDIDWDFEGSEYGNEYDGEHESEDENEHPDDMMRRPRKIDNFRKQNCPLWYKAGCVGNVEDLFWRQGSDGSVDSESPDYKNLKELGAAGLPLGECWGFYRSLIQQQYDILSGNHA
ncbi:hypothetical protein N7467_005586 [Penicillium canescens]|nr:hypothetical protein N7467_005586 [Penicillium canescens]